MILLHTGGPMPALPTAGSVLWSRSRCMFRYKSRCGQDATIVEPGDLDLIALYAVRRRV